MILPSLVRGALDISDLQDTTTPEKTQMLLEPAELQKQLQAPGLRILDTRSNEQYATGHIPGALRVDTASWQALGKTDRGFHNAKAWGEKVGQLGIDQDSRVVVYGSALPDAARIWWTLKYLGLENVALLNGGWEVWRHENRPTEIAVPKIVATPFVPTFQSERLEEIDTLKDVVRSGHAKLLDTRSTDEFTGKDVRGKRGGHIAAATHLEWKELLAANGRFKSRDQLQKLFRERGIVPDDTAICY